MEILDGSGPLIRAPQARLYFRLARKSCLAIAQQANPSNPTPAGSGTVEVIWYVPLPRSGATAPLN